MTHFSFPNFPDLGCLLLIRICWRCAVSSGVCSPLSAPTSTSESGHANPVGLRFSTAPHAFLGLIGHFMVSGISLSGCWLPSIELRVRGPTQPLWRVKRQHLISFPYRIHLFSFIGQTPLDSLALPL